MSTVISKALGSISSTAVISILGIGVGFSDDVEVVVPVNAEDELASASVGTTVTESDIETGRDVGAEVGADAGAEVGSSDVGNDVGMEVGTTVSAVVVGAAVVDPS
jgi:hypothetical protein